MADPFDFDAPGLADPNAYLDPSQMDEKAIERQLIAQYHQQQAMQSQQYHPQYQQVPVQGYAPQPQEQSFISEVEQRLEKAQYYKLLLNGWLFEGDSSESATSVMEEIRGFVVERLNVLMGLKPEVAAEQFSDEEKWALKQVAAKVLQRPAVVSPRPPPPAAQPKTKAQPKLRTVSSGMVQSAPMQQRQQQVKPPVVAQPKKDQAAPASREPQVPAGRIPFPTGAALGAASAGLAETSRRVKSNDTQDMTIAQLGLGQ